jgi:hypothetical protein
MEKYIMSFLPYKNMKMKLQADARKARQLLAAAKRPAKRQKKKKKSQKPRVRHLVSIGGRNFVSGSLAAGANGPMEGGSPAVNIVSPELATSQLIRQMADPFVETNDSDWPDPFTLMPTRKAKDLIHQALALQGGMDTTLNGSLGMYVRGDPFKSWGVASIGAVSSGLPFTWASCTNSMNASLPSGAMVRPIAIGHRFTFSGVGPYHSIVVRIMELPPWGPITSTYANFPTQPSLGPTFAQREYFRAREFTMNPGDTIQVNLYPADSTCLSFAVASAEREAWSAGSGAKSWSGFVMWVYGMSSMDTFYHDGIMRHAYFLPSPVTVPATAPNVSTLVKPSAAARDKALGTVVDRVSSGWNIFKSVVSTVASIASAAVPFLMSGGGNGMSRAQAEARADAYMAGLPDGPMARLAREEGSRSYLRIPAMSNTATVPIDCVVCALMSPTGRPREIEALMSAAKISLIEEKEAEEYARIASQSSSSTATPRDLRLHK